MNRRAAQLANSLLLRISLVILVQSLLTACSPTTPSRVDAPSRAKIEELRKICDLLTSPVSSEQATGMKELQDHQHQYFALLTEFLSSPDLEVQADAARTIRIFVSPWARGLEAGQRSHGHMSLFLPWRPTSRPTDHPEAPHLRRALISAEGALLDKQNRWIRGDSGAAISASSAICQCLAEVADDDSIQQLARFLECEDDTHLCAGIMGCLETFYGLHPGYRPHGICGNSSFLEIWLFRRSEAAICRREKKDLLQWRQEKGIKPMKDRLEKAFAQWNRSFDVYLDPHGVEEAVQQFEPLIRMGESALPLLVKKKNESTRLYTKGNVEFIIATITGNLDKPLVRELLRSEPEVACRVIVAAGSRDWKEELDQLQYRDRFDTNIASGALAICHRKAAIPLLKKAADSSKWNYTARYAVMELESWKE